MTAKRCCNTMKFVAKPGNVTKGTFFSAALVPDFIFLKATSIHCKTVTEDLLL